MIKIVAFDGVDASGKRTQATLTAEWLRKETGKQVLVMSFPQYETPTGQAITREFQREEGIRPYYLHSLMATNKLEYLPFVQIKMADPDVILCMDRWIKANVAYGMAEDLPKHWLEELEEPLPQADIYFYLRIPLDISFKRKPGRHDKFEENKMMLSKVINNYDNIWANNPASWTIDANKEISEVQESIKEVLKGRLK